MTYNPHAIEQTFPAFLKDWRQRRRLSQFELSLESGMSQKHISFLETGRSNPSRFAIAQLADALEMPAAEVDAMLLAAGFAARSSRKEWDSETKKAVDESLVYILEGHSPFPAVVIDRIWNLLKANRSAQNFFELAGSSGDSNLLREVLKQGPIRESIVNWEDTARALVRMLELEIARRPHDDEAIEFLREIKSIEGVSSLMEQPVFMLNAPVLSIRFQIDGAILNVFSLIATIGMSADATLDDLRVETLLPSDDPTRDWFYSKVTC